MNYRPRSQRRRFAAPVMTVATVAAAGLLIARARRRFDLSGKTVVISGGSRGLGLEIARCFAAEGAHLVLLARNEESLARAAAELRGYGTRVVPLSCDITQRQQVSGAVKHIYDTMGTVDVLVNNAGAIQVGPLDNMTLRDFENALAVHFWGPLYLLNEILPSMKARRQGRIVNIASIGGKVPVPHLTPYVASKFALVGLSEGLRLELLKDGIYMTTACPGLMRTGSHLNASFKGQHQKEFALFAMANASPLLSTSSAYAARKIVDACRYGRAEIIITPQARALALLHGVFPGLMSEIFSLVNYMLPKATADQDTARLGGESRSPLAAAVLTGPADRAAARNNELAPIGASPDTSEASGPPADDEPAGRTRCSCTHATHFLGRCQTEVAPPEHTCSACMENHFHRIDDPAI